MLERTNCEYCNIDFEGYYDPDNERMYLRCDEVLDSLPELEGFITPDRSEQLPESMSSEGVDLISIESLDDSWG